MHSPSFSYTNPVIVSIFKHAIYVSAVLWIIGIALFLVLGATLAKRITLFNL